MNSGQGVVFYVMGVSGCGKSTLGKQLAKTLAISFFEGDDFHPESNLHKMSQGIALTDSNRLPWLKILRKLAHEHGNQGCAISCSALKASYRKVLSEDLQHSVVWVYLEGDYETILGRMQKRAEHFMPVELLNSQFETLEPPVNAIRVPVELSTEKQVELVLSQIENHKKSGL